MRNVGSFPFGTSLAAGAVIDQGAHLTSLINCSRHIITTCRTLCFAGVPLVCSGNDKYCYKYFDGSWRKSAQFPTPFDRTTSTYDPYGLGLVLAGGFNITAVVATKDGNTFRQLASLPDHSANACLAPLDKASNLLYVGGYRETGNVNDVFKYLAVLY